MPVPPEALNPHTPSGELVRLSGSRTRAIKAAVASNPNTPLPTLLALFSQYPHEVLTNPSFVHYGVFAGDSFAKRIGDAYQNPEQGLYEGYRLYKGSLEEKVVMAMLLSEGSLSLEKTKNFYRSVFIALSKQTVKTVLDYRHVKSKVTKNISLLPEDFILNFPITLWGYGLVDTEKVIKVIKSSNHWVIQDKNEFRSIFTKSLKGEIKAYSILVAMNIANESIVCRSFLSTFGPQTPIEYFIHMCHIAQDTNLQSPHSSIREIICRWSRGENNNIDLNRVAELLHYCPLPIPEIVSKMILDHRITLKTKPENFYYLMGRGAVNHFKITQKVMEYLGHAGLPLITDKEGRITAPPLDVPLPPTPYSHKLIK